MGLFPIKCEIEGHEITSTISVGASIYPEDSLDAKDLLKKADVALYDAKKQGRNQFQVYTKKTDSEG